jgi:hypothetical protein
VVCAGQLARPAVVKKAVEQLNHISPGYRISKPRLSQAMRSIDQLRWDEGLRLAGIPE